MTWDTIVGTPCFISLLLLLTFSLRSSSSIPIQVIVDGQTFVSSAQAFELGFFSPDPSSSRRYLGIWYKNIPVQTVVWVANRESPLTDTTGVLNLTTDGNLILSNQFGHIFWSTNTSNIINPVVQLLDSGNLVLSNGSLPIWQSFDYPSHVLLPGMKLGWDSSTNFKTHLTSWKSLLDPSIGLYSYKLDMTSLPEAFLLNGSAIRARSGPWNGHGFGGLPSMQSDNYFSFQLVDNRNEIYYSYNVVNMSVTSILILDSTGELQRLVWLNNAWSSYFKFPLDECDNYAECGSYGVCLFESMLSCGCLPGFVPKLAEEWDFRVWSGGCLRRVELDCGMGLKSTDGFLKVSALKLPDTSNASINESMDFDACKNGCLNECSCKAFAISVGGVCVSWYSDLLDIRQFSNGGVDLYVRLAASEINSLNGGSSKKELIIIIILVFGICLILLGALLFWKKKRRQGIISTTFSDEIGEQDLELPLFDIGTINSATNSFSIKNILGEGGFGLVYKGQLADGREIAVKRLSNDSVQGLYEFKNEVVLIAKLQHRNLVRLLGCCIQGEDLMLIYEYMQNKSLDDFIFDKAKGALLDWQKRIDIIIGIARGLLYLHQDSRFNIIHRDIKASNILLDKELNPKISDFGTARIFEGDKKQESTKRVVGTYGYMSPEYAMDGIYSVKSDVFSFGVIILEILSGKKNRVIYEGQPCMNLLGHTWELWMEDKSLELLDESLDCACLESEILRCIQVGLLCVQEGSDDRPTMSSVVVMLESKTVDLPLPKRPGFCRRTVNESASPYADQFLHTTNEVSITMLGGR